MQDVEINAFRHCSPSAGKKTDLSPKREKACLLSGPVARVLIGILFHRTAGQVRLCCIDAESRKPAVTLEVTYLVRAKTVTLDPKRMNTWPRFRPIKAITASRRGSSIRVYM